MALRLLLVPLLMTVLPGSGEIGSVPVTPIFVAGGIPVHDAGIGFTEAEVRLIQGMISGLPQDHRAGVKKIIVEAISEHGPSESEVLDAQGVLTVRPFTRDPKERLGLQIVGGIGLHVCRNVLSKMERNLFAQRPDDPLKPAFVEPIFTVYYSTYVSGSDSSLLTSLHGQFPSASFRTLFVASLFADRDSGRISTSLWAPSSFGVDSLEAYRTDDELKIGRFTFYLQDSAVVGASAVADGGRPSLPRFVMQLKQERNRWPVPVALPEVILGRFKRAD